MKYLKFNSLFVIVFFFFSCDKYKPGEHRLNSLDYPIVTGFEFKDEEGNSMGNYGGPVNNKVGDKKNMQESEYFLNAFPNPVSEKYFVSTKTPSNRPYKNVWIVKASYNGELSNIVINNNSVNFIAGGGHLLYYYTQQNMAVFDISSLEDGYYRVYAELGETIFYDNFIVYKNKTNSSY